MAKQRAMGADAVHLFGKETTYGTAPADGYLQLPMRTFGLGADQPLEDDPVWNRGSSEASDPSLGALTVTGDMSAPFDARGCGAFLAMVLGAPVSVEDDDLFVHTFKSGLDIPSFTHQVGHPKLDVPRWRSNLGVKAGGLQFPMARNGRLVGTIPLVGQKEVKDSTGTRDASPTKFAYLPFNNATGSIKVGNALLGSVTAAQFNYSNGMETADGIRPDMAIDGVDEGMRTSNGSVTVRLSSDTTIDDLADTNTPASMEFKFTLLSKPGWSLAFHLPRVFFARTRNPVDGPGGISATVNWTAAKDDAEGYMLSVVLINDVESY